MRDSIYLDYAATSAIRPEAVIEAVTEYLRDIGATPGRSGHRRAIEAGRVMLRCRQALAELFGIAGDPGRIAFQFNATHALNTALFGLLNAGDRVVRTAYDHNAVRRPIAALRLRGVREIVLSGRPDAGIDLDEAEQALRGARLLVLPHASNVIGALLPVAELAERAHAQGALVLLDACQTAGHLPVQVNDLRVDLLAFTGHKGLLGPQGTGGLWVREGIEVAPLLLGGTGGDSDSEGMPGLLPDRLEAGSQNGPGLAGLLAGVGWVLGQQPTTLHEREARLKIRLYEQLHATAGVRVHSPAAPDGVGIVTLTADILDAATLAGRLDREHGVLARAGLHCAPGAHAALGTERAGALRLSLGWATTQAEVDRAADAIRQVCGAKTPEPVEVM
ncbi:MAG: aminotransferase class V-fold PLP-dependent enzyme [Gemmatimonadota bacterium]|nr:aminotransferase class V-fold PLP-dependent enzyme [Gemmatimonadota bacterium]